MLDCYKPYLLLLAQGQIGPKLAVRCDAEDVVQQTMIEACQAFPGFRGATEPEFSAWIKQIHRHNVIEMVRKHRTGNRSIEHERRWDDGDGTASFRWHEPAEEQTTASQRAIKGEDALRLASRLQQLPESQREAVRLRYIKGMPIEEIARQMGKSVSATAGLIKRGLQSLRERMNPESWL